MGDDGIFLELICENFTDEDCTRLESEYRFYWFLKVATQPGGLAFTRIWKHLYEMHEEGLLDAQAFYGC